jgi:uncharacterized protein YjbI with pentapeptide repeats
LEKAQPQKAQLQKAQLQKAQLQKAQKAQKPLQSPEECSTGSPGH